MFRVRISYIEVYNECVYDLLNPSPVNGPHGSGSNAFGGLDLREDPDKGVFVAGVHEVEVAEATTVLALLERGNARRSTEATKANSTSSRSHAVLSICIEASEALADVRKEMALGKLSLIDLAGSERMGKTNNMGARLREGNNINRSLLALANCINALGEKNSRGKFVNYRDSKLTRLLKESLGGNSKTVMLCCLAPSADAFEETTSTLKYAHRAKNIQTKVVRNTTSVTAHIAEYQQIISDLRNEIGHLRAQVRHVSEMETPVPPPGTPGHGSFDGMTTISRRAARSTGGVRVSLPPGMKVTDLTRPLDSSFAFGRDGAVVGGGAGGKEGEGSACGPAGQAAAPGEAGADRGEGEYCSDEGESDEEERSLLSGTMHMQQVQAELLSNFQDRLQLRRSLLELNETTKQNQKEVVSLAEQQTALRAESTDGQGEVELLRLEADALSLLRNEAQNEELRASLAERLRDNEIQSREMYSRLPQSVTSEGLRQFLRLLSSNQMMELEVMQLELQLRMREHLEEAMVSQLDLRDTLIQLLLNALHSTCVSVPAEAQSILDQILPPEALRVLAVQAAEAQVPNVLAPPVLLPTAALTPDAHTAKTDNGVREDKNTAASAGNARRGKAASLERTVDTGKPDIRASDTGSRGSAIRRGKAASVERLDTGKPESKKADTGRADTGATTARQARRASLPSAERLAGTRAADTGGPDTGAADTGRPDTGRSETGAADTGEADCGPADFGRSDTGRPRTGGYRSEPSSRNRTPPTDNRALLPANSVPSQLPRIVNTNTYSNSHSNFGFAGVVAGSGGVGNMSARRASQVCHLGPTLC